MKKPEKQMVRVLREARENPKAQQVLTEAQQQSLLKLVTARCRHDTKRIIAERISRPFKEWPSRWAIERLFLEGDEVTYCAGQDYTYEITQLRKQLIEWC